MRNSPPPKDPTVALCPGTHGDPRGVNVFDERGIPVCASGEAFLGGWGFLMSEEHLYAPSQRLCVGRGADGGGDGGFSSDTMYQLNGFRT